MKVHGSNVWAALKNTLLFLLLLCIVVLLMLVVAALIPVFIFATIWCRVREKWFLLRLSLQQRRMPWCLAQCHLLLGEGTFLIEVDQVGGRIRRVWWLPERVAKLCPTAPWSSQVELRRWPLGTTALFELAPPTRAWFDQQMPGLAPTAFLVDVSPEHSRTILNGTVRQYSVLVAVYPAISRRANRMTAFGFRLSV